MPSRILSKGSVEERLEEALSEDIPKIYFNGFVCTMTNSDVIIVTERMGQPVATLNVSFTTAKTLAQTLAGVIAQLESKMDRDIMTTHDIDKTMSKED